MSEDLWLAQMFWATNQNSSIGWHKFYSHDRTLGPIQYKNFGDSAYYDSDVIGTGGGQGMSSVRETVEWTYANLKVHWKDFQKLT